MPSCPEFLREVCEAQGIEKLTPVASGGSPARVWLAERGDRRQVVIKALAAGDGLVDGHDLRSFRLKPRQIRQVHADLPRLSPYYVQLLGAWDGPGWSAYAMRRHGGDRCCAPLRRPTPDSAAFDATLVGVLRVLTEHGYAARVRPAPPDHFRTMHINRVRRRLPVLRAHLEPELFAGADLVINGRPVPPLAPLLARAEADPALGAALQPARLHYPVHGDLNLGNLLVRSPAGGRAGPAFTVLDPRGTLDDWDPVYDFAKALFSLTMHELALGGGFVIRRRGTRYDVALRRPSWAYWQAAVAFEDLLAALPFCAELDRTDPGWRRRLRAAHAMHCLAEAACRLSDRKHRDFGPVRGWAACVELARGLLLAGLALLADLIRGADALDQPLARHLAGLEEFAACAA